MFMVTAVISFRLTTCRKSGLDFLLKVLLLRDNFIPARLCDCLPPFIMTAFSDIFYRNCIKNQKAAKAQTFLDQVAMDMRYQICIQHRTYHRGLIAGLIRGRADEASAAAAKAGSDWLSTWFISRYKVLSNLASRAAWIAAFSSSMIRARSSRNFPYSLASSLSTTWTPHV